MKLEPRDDLGDKSDEDPIDGSGADEPLSPSSKTEEDKVSSELLSLNKQSLKHFKHEPSDDVQDQISGEDEARSDEVHSD